jgi:hypothetical protein
MSTPTSKMHTLREMTTEDEVEEFLAQKWNTLELDRFSALWSRIANNAVFLKAENQSVIESVYCI